MSETRCRCSPLDVLAWTGSKRITTTFNDQSFGGLSAVRVPAVYARYIHDNTGIAERAIPPISSEPNYQITLPVFATSDKFPFWETSTYGGLWVTTLWGSHPFRHNGQWHAAYPMGCLTGPDLATVDEDSHVMDHVHILNLETRQLVHSYYLPQTNPAIVTPHSYIEFSGDYGGGGHAPLFDSTCHGFSGKTWVISGKHRGGTPWFHRHNFETLEHGLALGAYSIVEGECVIELPAQAADDGRAWVAAFMRDGVDWGIYTGAWENPDVCTDFIDPSSFRAILTPDERLHKISDKPGDNKSWSVEDIAGAELHSYTRMHGFDYLVVQLTGGQRWWYDGRRERWQRAMRPDGEGGSEHYNAEQIYDCEDGSVVVAGDDTVQYFSPEGEVIWTYHPGAAANRSDRGIKISANGRWIMVGNCLGSRGDVFDRSTADLTAFGTLNWMGNTTDYTLESDTVADWPLCWSLSKSPKEDGQPVVVCHREYDDRKWFPNFAWRFDEGLGFEVYDVDPSYQAEDGYTVRIYCGNADIKRGDYTVGVPVNGRMHYMGGPGHNYHWSLFPGCRCGNPGASVNPTGY